jgi:hypothetical protein
MEKQKNRLITSLIVLLNIVLVGLFIYFHLMTVPRLQFSVYNKEITAIKPDTLSIAQTDVKALNRKLDQLSKKMQRFAPGKEYLVISTTNNTFKLFKNNQVIREGKCSTGSFINLEVDSTKSFIFETPKGVMTVQAKKTNPVWSKPDWAFIEEGLPVPPKGHSSRFEANVLGDYALALGDGYLIHGTLYQRLIGSSVTHGCVRMLDDDLEAVYKTLPVGAKVYIY